MSKKMTLKGLGELLNLSVSTVSKALANSTEISESTKELVRAAAREHRYRPNSFARGLKNRQTKTLGVLIPNILAHFFSKVLVGMEEEATKNGYSLVTCITNESLEKEKQSLDMLSNVGVDAILISMAAETQRTGNVDHLNDILHYEVPIVLFDRASSEVHCDSVVINDFKGAYDAVSFLYQTGCRDIAFLSTLFSTSVGKERERGYGDAVMDFKKDRKPRILHTTLDELEKDFSGFLDTHKIDGVLAADELTAIYAMNVLRSKGKKIPEDVSVIGFTDGVLAKNYYPALTTVNQQAQSIGRAAVLAALKNLEDPSAAPQTQIIDTQLVVRQSTRKLN